MEQQSNFVANVTIGYGAFLIAWGIAVSVLSESNSITSFLPSMLGAPLLVSGVMTLRKPEKKKLWMHIAATFGLLCALGGTHFFMVMGDGLNYASGSTLMLLLTGSAYTTVCVRSFIAARKAREAAA